MKRWLKILLFADLFISLAMGMIAPIYAIFVEEIGGSILDASGAWAVFSFTAGFLIWLFGKWEDRVKHLEKVLFLGYLLRCFGFLGYFFVMNKYHLFGVQILIGISCAMSRPAYDALYSKLLSKGKFASEWGTWEAMDMMIAAVAAILGGIIVNYFGFRSLFLVMFISSLIGLFIASKLLVKKLKKG